MIALRPATPDDIDAVLAFWLEATAEPSSTDDADGLAALLERSPGSLILAVEGGAIVGSVVAGWDGWRGTIYRLAVAPAYRRRGIATQLVAAAEAAAAHARRAPHAPHRLDRGRCAVPRRSGRRRGTSRPIRSGW